MRADQSTERGARVLRARKRALLIVKAKGRVLRIGDLLSTWANYDGFEIRQRAGALDIWHDGRKVASLKAASERRVDVLRFKGGRWEQELLVAADWCAPSGTRTRAAGHARLGASC